MLQRGFADEASTEFAAMQASVSEAQTAAQTAQKEAESLQVSRTSVLSCVSQNGRSAPSLCSHSCRHIEAIWPLLLLVSS